MELLQVEFVTAHIAGSGAGKGSGFRVQGRENARENDSYTFLGPPYF